MSLQVETCDWGGDTQEELGKLVAGFVSDILASSGRGGGGKEAADDSPHDSEDQRKMRLRAMSTCLSPFRALYLHGMDHQQALVAAIYFAQQAEQRAKALPSLLPASTHLFWEPGQSECWHSVERAALGASLVTRPAL